MHEREEIEEYDDQEHEECPNPFHDEGEPQEDALALVMAAMGEPVISQLTSLGEEEGEERQELLRQRQRYHQERCPRCGRRHENRSAQS